VFDFTLSEEELLIQETARRFAAARLEPRLRAHEAARGVPSELTAEFAALGLDGIDLPSESGGQALGSFAKALVLEELAAVDPGAALALEGIGPAVYPLVEGGLASLLGELRREAGIRGAVIEDIEQRFRLSNSGISGEHAWVPADRLGLLVVLQEERALVISGGIDPLPISCCGLEAAGGAQLVLRDHPVAARVEDARALARARSRIRVYVAALLVGAARGAHRYAMRYATERTAFGRPIAHHQALAFLLADMAIAVDAGRLAVWRAAVALDRGGDAEWEAAAALAEAAEQALFVGPNAVQVLGGHGFMKDHPVEKSMRDIRTLAQLAGGRDEAELAAARRVLEHEVKLA
jgi:alkylation response protein AidB-like acyl-CoA dehydrogenase